VDTTISFGRSSFDIEHKLTLNDQTCVECWETRVWVVKDESGRLRSRAVPEPVLEKFRS
jgi:4-hydroxybenzoyl-CoA thioesterase